VALESLLVFVLITESLMANEVMRQAFTIEVEEADSERVA
jgi:hypothetical protein